MLNRLSLDHLLKAVLAALAAALIGLISLDLGASWQTLARSREAQRVVEASRQIVTGLVNMRPERATMQRSWDSEAGLSSEAKATLVRYQAAEMPALAAAFAIVEGMSFDHSDTLVPAMRESIDRLDKMRQAYWAGIAAPRSERKPGFGKAYNDESLKLQRLLEDVSAILFARVRNDNAFIGQMLLVKQLAWMVRNSAGEASLLITQSLTAGRPEANLLERWNGFRGEMRAQWQVIDDTIQNTQLPDSFLKTVADARAALFGSDYRTAQQRLIDELLAGRKPDITPDAWSNYSVPHMVTTMNVADAALEQASHSAATVIDTARFGFARNSLLLLGCLAAVAGGFLFVGRRITAPLLQLRAVTDRFTAGDFTAETNLSGRHDEIGSIAAALTSFRQQALEKQQIEAEQRSTRERAAQRQSRMENDIDAFQQTFATTLSSLDSAREQLGTTANDMTHIAQRSAGAIRNAEQATAEASNNVAGIAAATEELNASIREIARQVAESTQVSQRAVTETQRTDETVRRLAESASRIGEVVGLISSIAAQTNLLALNATIEAARAGEAGKGFAVVASEVKSLANQTAKATEEIGSQIASVRTVTQDAVRAIGQIRGTIDDVNAVSSTIASNIEQQGAALEEIARNTQLAADRTRTASGGVTAVLTETDATTSSASAVQSAATSVDQQTDYLRRQVDTFMTRLRAA